MTLRPITLASIASLFLSCYIINVNGATNSPTEHSHQSLTLDTNSLNSLIAKTGAGALEIQAITGLSHIKLEADIYTYEGIDPILTLEKNGNSAQLIANFDKHNTHGNSPYIDLIVNVPATMKMDIHDGSGKIRIQGSNANIKLKDGSGSIDINGDKNINIEDGSGSITLTDVDGAIMLDDGSGSVKMARINGDVTINDGSGSISVVNTKGLKIIEAGSGKLSFDHIDGKISM